MRDAAPQMKARFAHEPSPQPLSPKGRLEERPFLDGLWERGCLKIPDGAPKHDHRSKRQKAANDRHHDDVEITFPMRRVTDRE